MWSYRRIAHETRYLKIIEKISFDSYLWEMYVFLMMVINCESPIKVFSFNRSVNIEIDLCTPPWALKWVDTIGWLLIYKLVRVATRFRPVKVFWWQGLVHGFDSQFSAYGNSLFMIRNYIKISVPVFRCHDWSKWLFLLSRMFRFHISEFCETNYWQLMSFHISSLTEKYVFRNKNSS